MSKTVSYFEWSLNYRKKDDHSPSASEKKSVKPVKKDTDTNSLGIRQNEFKNFMDKWRKNNL